MQGVCMKTLNGNTFLAKFTTANGHQGLYVRAIVGVGNPYWVWSSIPNAGKVIAADFTNAPICKQDINANLNDIASITVTPQDFLTWYEPTE